MEDSYSLVHYTIFLLVIVGISIAIKYFKNRNISKEKEYISRLENTNHFESLINNYLDTEYKLKFDENEDLIKEKNELSEHIKALFFKDGHEIKSQYVKSEEEYLMTHIYLYYDKQIYETSKLQDDNAITKLDVKRGTEIIMTSGGAEFDENGDVKVDEEGKVIFKPDKENKVSYTEIVYRMNKRGIVKYKIYLSSLEYFKNKRIREERIKEVKNEIDNLKIVRKIYNW